MDYITNIVYNSLRGYPESLNLFRKIIKPKIRKVSGKSIQKTGFIPMYLSKYNKESKGLRKVNDILSTLELNIE